ncbi:MAG TPA: ABC transporter permease [Thermoanaerobaculia bacterium]|nr:ABC transporter permease [Thermoanaerobaculia bacterium]
MPGSRQETSVERAAARGAGRKAELFFRRPTPGTLVVTLAGAWQLGDRSPGGGPAAAAVEAELEGGGERVLALDGSELTAWDSSLLLFVVEVRELGARRQVEVDLGGLPAGVRRLLALAEAVPEATDARAAPPRAPWLERVGFATLAVARDAGGLLGFLGETALACGRLLRGKARYRRSDLALFIQQAGVEALPIVGLISFLVGLILAFVGAVQLERFGAAIYVADLVGIAMVREMGAMMTGIVMAGRTGASFAAQLGTMKVTQEIDALTTLGISPIEFLVLPRLAALCLMMPLLCLYSDLLGVAGGAVVGTGLLHLSLGTYLRETASAVSLGNLWGGVLKAFVYGILVALAGCRRGLSAGTSSAAVGQAVTSAVVTGIVAIITACGVFAVLFYVLGI